MDRCGGQPAGASCLVEGQSYHHGDVVTLPSDCAGSIGCRCIDGQLGDLLGFADAPERCGYPDNCPDRECPPDTAVGTACVECDGPVCATRETGCLQACSGDSDCDSGLACSDGVCGVECG